jgi:hypothetical protein
MNHNHCMPNLNSRKKTIYIQVKHHRPGKMVARGQLADDKFHCFNKRKA